MIHERMKAMNELFIYEWFMNEKNESFMHKMNVSWMKWINDSWMNEWMNEWMNKWIINEWLRWRMT